MDDLNTFPASKSNVFVIRSGEAQPRRVAVAAVGVSSPTSAGAKQPPASSGQDDPHGWDASTLRVLGELRTD